MKKSKENAKGAPTHRMDSYVVLGPLKTCSRFRFAQTKTDLRQLKYSKQLKSEGAGDWTLTVLNIGLKWL